MDPQETKIYSAVVITCILIGCIVTYFIISLIRQHRHNLFLQRKNLTMEISAMEKERSRIAADLHDEIAPYLSIARMKCAELNFQRNKEPEGKKEVEDLLDQALRRIREISFDLMPASLLRNGLISAIREYIALINKTYTLSIAVVAEQGFVLAAWKQIHVYRIIQEIIQNAIKHSQASEMLLVFSKLEKQLVIKIADNGIAFDMEQEKAKATGFGLRSLENRVDLIEGKLFVNFTKEKGMSYVIEIPAA